MVSDPAAADREPETVNALRAAAEPFNGRIRVDSNVPYAEVKAAWERAEVGMVLTTGPEPFGRTALEAMASGAALITSGRGGLAEICGPCAVTVEPSDADGVAAALGQFLDAPDRRAELAPRRTQARRGFVRHPNHCRGRWTTSSRPASGKGADKRDCLTRTSGRRTRSSETALGHRLQLARICLAFAPRRREVCGPVSSNPTILKVATPAGDEPLIARGARFWRTNFALFLGSFATFAMLYCVQPLMPSFTRAFSISPAAASLSLSAATGVLAVAMIFAGTLSDALGRKTVMTASLAAAAAATLAASFSPNWTTFVALRALTGLALSGVPAVAMAYLVEEMDRSAIGLAMGLYIAGNTVGGLGGRLATAAFAEAGGWRRALVLVGLISLGCAAAFAFALPRERRIPLKTGRAALLPTSPCISATLA